MLLRSWVAFRVYSPLFEVTNRRIAGLNTRLGNLTTRKLTA